MKIQDIIKYKVGTPVFLDYKGINTLYSHIITNYPIENIAKSYKITFDNNFYFIRDKEITYILHIENIDQKWDVKNFILKNFYFNIEGLVTESKNTFSDPFDFYYTLKEIQSIKKYVDINSLLEIILSKTLTEIPIKNNFIIDTRNSSIQFFRIIMEEMFRRGVSYQGILLMDEYHLLEHFIPEITKLKEVNHDKDFHPEGDGFDHLLETSSYIKTTDYAFAWATLLHDIGKPFSYKEENRKFSNHGKIGAEIAAKILKKMEYDEEVIKETYFLIENHMIPPMIDKLSYEKKEKIINSKYFKKLLKLYKIDILSSHKDLSKYSKTKKYIAELEKI